MENIPAYIGAKHGRQPVSYPHPDLEPILRDTYGIIVYQEQIMQIASVMAGFSLGQADLLRRAVGKKKREVLQQQREMFVEGCLRNGYEEQIANDVYDLIVRFADYGFNRSHAVAYAVVAYRTAYLKANYPAEFMAALLTSWLHSSGKVAQYVDDCRKMGIRVLAPDVNESFHRFTVSDGQIRFALSAIKNVGIAAIQTILQTRSNQPFADLLDFCRRVDTRSCNKRVIESLIRSGAFDYMGRGRRTLLLALDDAVDTGSRLQKEQDAPQISMFGMMDHSANTETLSYPEVDDFSETERLEMEKELLGLYVSGHPLDRYRAAMERNARFRIAELAELEDGSQATIAGRIRHLKPVQTRKGQTMAFMELEDLTGVAEVIVFPSVFADVRPILQQDQVIVMKAKLQMQEDETKLIAESIRLLPAEGVTDNRQPTSGNGKGDGADNPYVNKKTTPATPSFKDANENRPNPDDEDRTETLFIKIESNKEDPSRLRILKACLIRHPGPTPVVLYYAGKKQTRQITERVFAQPDLLQEIERIMGTGSTILKK